MDIFYPYNESLPKRTAHDVYLFRNCASLSDLGLPVSLACGWGGWEDRALFQHYGVNAQCPLKIQRLPILRRLGPLSCNALFFWAAQRAAARQRPRWLLTSVFKQADYHIRRKIQGIGYVYEVHQLSWYPTCDTPERRQIAERERQILSQMDLVTTTTQALSRILRNPPYSLTVPIEVVPLAVDCAPLSPAPKGAPFTVMYIGQLYPSQGVDLLLRALKQTPEVHLEIIGGTTSAISGLRALTQNLELTTRVRFHGFLAPGQIPAQAARANAFVAPFYAVERMPYVAHTKLLEYASWGRPIIAPRVEVVLEDVTGSARDLLFHPGDVNSLADTLRRVLQMPYSPTGDVLSWKSRATLYRDILEHLPKS